MKASTQRTLPQGWQWKKFGDCAQFINGRAYSQHELLDSGTPVLRIQNLNGGDRWYYSNLNLPEDKYCEAGDLLYAWSASFGPYRFSGPKSIFHYHIWRVIPGAELDKDFTFHLLEEITAEVKSAAHGVAMLHMTKGGIEAWPIPLPPLAEQRRIAEVLDRAEALRAKRRAALAELDSLTQSLFLDLFGDPVTNPKKLPQVSLAEITTRITDGTHLTPKFVDSGVPFIFVKNVRNGSIDFHTDKFISEEEHATLYKRCPVQEGDVLYTTVGATYGQAALVGTFTKFAFQRHLAHLKPDPTKVVPSFLGTTMQLPLVKQQADRWARGAAQPTINLKELREMVIPLPPIALQQEFARRVGAVEKLKQAQRAALAEQDALFATLQHRAFRGEL